MAINAYESEQTIDYTSFKRTFYGFHVSSNCDSGDVHPFDGLEQRAAFISAIQGAVPRLEDYDAFIVAALLALSIFDQDEGWGYALDISGLLAEDDDGVEADAVHFAAQEFLEGL